MKKYIQAIMLFNECGEKRVVALEPGVNIITGESKTGKSEGVADWRKRRFCRTRKRYRPTRKIRLYRRKYI